MSSLLFCGIPVCGYVVPRVSMDEQRASERAERESGVKLFAARDRATTDRPTAGEKIHSLSATQSLDSCIFEE